MKRARVVKVPYSASNLSNNGVRARRLRKAWKKPAWTRGKVFVLYTKWQTYQYLLFKSEVTAHAYESTDS